MAPAAPPPLTSSSLTPPPSYWSTLPTPRIYRPNRTFEARMRLSSWSGSRLASVRPPRTGRLSWATTPCIQQPAPMDPCRRCAPPSRRCSTQRACMPTFVDMTTSCNTSPCLWLAAQAMLAEALHTTSSPGLAQEQDLTSMRQTRTFFGGTAPLASSSSVCPRRRCSWMPTSSQVNTCTTPIFPAHNQVCPISALMPLGCAAGSDSDSDSGSGGWDGTVEFFHLCHSFTDDLLGLPALRQPFCF
mmetsp:Transcript_19724/g.33878  ORF Transcript_19724/g.33878 Transcript_19724/m.33878 type:complete len:244 (+) Transcript_19724:688-1419(+)